MQLNPAPTIQRETSVMNVSANIQSPTSNAPSHHHNRQVSGLHKTVIKYGMWVNILIVAIWKYKNVASALKKIRLLSKAKDAYRGENKLLKYSLAGNRYFFSYNAPGWPSKSFNRYIQHQLAQFDDNTTISLHTLIFGITKKCGFKCEHCFEWENLNKPETLAKEDVSSVIKNFRNLGVSIVQFSGGEPLNRLADITDIVQDFTGIDFWIYTSGYHLTNDKAAQLKKAGLTGITISLDHWLPELHDSFRGKKGSFKWVEKAAQHTVANNLILCLSLCATNEFISQENLFNYIELAKNLNASFIQILEPKAVGHYAGKNVSLSEEKIRLLEHFYEKINFNRLYKNYPTIIYHGFYSRRVGCSGAGKDYLYVDMDGFAHDCPFCQKKIFNVLQGDVEEQLTRMRTLGCNVFNSVKIK